MKVAVGEDFTHHATLCIAAHGFLIAERSRFTPCSRRSAGTTRPANSARVPASRRALSGIIHTIATLRIRLARFRSSSLPASPILPFASLTSLCSTRETEEQSWL